MMSYGRGFLRFVSRSKSICGHNLITHDLKYVQKDLEIAHYTPEAECFMRGLLLTNLAVVFVI